MTAGPDMLPSTSERLRAFVKGALGCACADALFQDASIEFAPSAPDALFDIVVAGRLLVRCYRVMDQTTARAAMGERVAAGRRQRDALGTNRFRLVLAAERPQVLSASLRDAFEAARGGDERVHLHVLGLAAIEPLFAASC